MIIDYHIHTSHSTDAKGTITEYCTQALKLGLTEICFTNHCELDPQRDDDHIRFNGKILPYTYDHLAQLRDEVYTAQDEFRSSGLNVKFGIEIGYFDGIEQRLQNVIRDITFDFVLGSVHCLQHMCIDSSKEYLDYFSQHDAAYFVEEYFETTNKLVQSRLFDAVAHLDVYKKYGITYYGTDIRKVPEHMLRHVFQLMNENKVAMELNTAGLRKVNEFYPSPQIMEIARDEKLERLTIGSDAHTVDDLGKGIAQGIDYLRSFGFDTIYRFDQRTPIPLKI
jgi:histidinol-phosphatase (PHP family)